MTQAIAMAQAQRLAACLRARGVEVSIELQKDVSGSWTGAAKRGVLSHHTASYPRQGLTPMLALVKRGRTNEGIPGPLANGYGGYDRVYRIITMGKANHAGTGGPLTLASTTPANYGNSFLWGTEYEGGYEPWTAEMREFMARANAGILDFFGWGPNAHAEHKNWTKRKIDRLGYTLEQGRNEIITLGGKPGSLAPVPNAPAPVGGSPWDGKDGNAAYSPGARILTLYSAGTDVKFVQRVIGSKEDGLYGADSISKAKTWQSANGLVPDGIIGALSWAKMLAPAKAKHNLAISGVLDTATITALQIELGTLKDGFISGLYTSKGRVGNSKFSSLVEALQKKFGTPRDGKISTPTSLLITTMQKRYGLIADGHITAGSSGLVKEIQRRLNAGTF